MTYWQFKNFAYQTMMKETDKETGSWPGVLFQKDFDMIIKLCLQREIKKRYVNEV